MQNEPVPYFHDDEITLSDLLHKLGTYWVEIKRNWLLVIGISLLMASLFAIKSHLTPATYPAKLTFMVNEDDSGQGMGAINGILGQFGLGGGGSEHNLDKIMALSKTRRIIQNSLSEQISIENKRDFTANHIIDIYKLNDDWSKAKKPILKDYRFSHFNTDSFNLVDNTALKAVFGQVVGNEDKAGFFSNGYDKKTGIMYLNVNSESEDLSIALSESIFKEISQFYIEKTIERQKFTYDLLKTKADSIEGLINQKQGQILKFDDTARNLLLQQNSAPKLKSARELQLNTLLYGEVLKNLSLAEFSLKNSTPFVQGIDYPFSPIEPSVGSLLKSILGGFILGFFLASLYVIARHVIKTSLD